MAFRCGSAARTPLASSSAWRAIASAWTRRRSSAPCSASWRFGRTLGRSTSDERRLGLLRCGEQHDAGQPGAGHVRSNSSRSAGRAGGDAGFCATDVRQPCAGALARPAGQGPCDHRQAERSGDAGVDRSAFCGCSGAEWLWALLTRLCQGDDECLLSSQSL